MRITSLSINGLRNIESLTLAPSPGINQLTGPNGAGKTTVLEALHLLSLGRSFRTRKIHRLLAPKTDELSVRVEFTDPSSGQSHQAGILKTRAGDTTLKLDYQSLNSIVEVTRMLPVKVVNPDSHRLVQEGPDQRREFLDWGVFHVEQAFFPTWKQYRRALHQRNQILKVHSNLAELAAWDRELAFAGEQVNQFRIKYVDQLKPVVEAFAKRFSLTQEISMRYRSGWSKESTLLDALTAEQQAAIRPAFTTAGPHRAELALLADGLPAKDILSRGEQKLLVYALHFGQLQLFREATGRLPIILLDDLAAELDKRFCGRVVEELSRLEMQAFVSGNEPLEMNGISSTEIVALSEGKLAEVV